MGKRGKQSIADLAVTGPAALFARPDAPYALTDEQADVWRSVVDAVPADWFSAANYGLLEQFCRHMVSARRVSMLIAQIEGPGDGEALDIAEYDRLLKMQEREGRALSSLATRMRLTQQAVFDKSKRRPTTAGHRPWEA